MTDYPDHDQMTKYLLGALPSDVAERLDELSVSNDQFAEELKAAENDLVDAYVRGELSRDDTARFRSACDTMPKHRQKLAFAEALFAFQQQARTAEAKPGASKVATAGGWWFLPKGWLAPQWALAAALVLLVAAGYLVFSNGQLQKKLNQSENEKLALRRQLESKPADSGTESASGAMPSLEHLKIASFVLAPALRSSALPSLSFSSATDLVVVKLDLETTGFPRYQVSLEDAASRRSLWQSGELTPAMDGNKETVSFGVPASLLPPETYLLQLKGIRAGGATEMLSSYPFRAVPK